MCPHRQNCVKKHHALVSPFGKISVVRDAAAEVVFKRLPPVGGEPLPHVGRELQTRRCELVDQVLASPRGVRRLALLVVVAHAHRLVHRDERKPPVLHHGHHLACVAIALKRVPCRLGRRLLHMPRILRPVGPVDHSQPPFFSISTLAAESTLSVPLRRHIRSRFVLVASNTYALSANAA